MLETTYTIIGALLVLSFAIASIALSIILTTSHLKYKRDCMVIKHIYATLHQIDRWCVDEFPGVCITCEDIKTFIKSIEKGNPKFIDYVDLRKRLRDKKYEMRYKK